MGAQPLYNVSAAWASSSGGATAATSRRLGEVEKELRALKEAHGIQDTPAVKSPASKATKPSKPAVRLPAAKALKKPQRRKALA
jgi:hypothetical protein